MQQSVTSAKIDPKAKFLTSLTEYTKQHKARHWEGTFAEFVQDILPQDPQGISRTCHQYVWDMLRWTAAAGGAGENSKPIDLLSS